MPAEVGARRVYKVSRAGVLPLLPDSVLCLGALSFLVPPPSVF